MGSQASVRPLVPRMRIGRKKKNKNGVHWVVRAIRDEEVLLDLECPTRLEGCDSTASVRKKSGYRFYHVMPGKRIEPAW